MFRALGALVALGGLVAASPVQAFCGFYVSGADASLYSDATMVVMMREGTTTVLSMQNDYQGPPEAFALVVPVPVVLEEENVKILPHEVFDRVDALAAPRLVEYWEQDPCRPMMRYRGGPGGIPAPVAMAESAAAPTDEGVTVEAEFAVGEYDIVVLSARDSGGLDRWLRRNEYNIPEGAEPVLRPYVEQATKFFVAKVDPSRVTFQGNRAVLSPLRVHYDSDTFSLPVRLGLLNSSGVQDLIVHVLAQGQRYEVANYENVTIPTNIRVVNEVREDFGGFYRSLFDRVRERNPHTVVTEYAWDASSCDPCPTPALSPAELATLGGDVVGAGPGQSFVLTRLHYRYEKEDLDHDLVFRAAPPIVGGRGMPDAEGSLAEREAVQMGGINNFQGRYAILHPWEGAVACEAPQRGQWGGPPGGAQPHPLAAAGGPSATPRPAARASLGALVAADVESIDLRAGDAAAPATEPAPQPEPTPVPAATHSGEGGCAGCSVGSTGSALPPLVLVLFALRRSRRRRG
ncbi:MAG: hypothetical protein CMN30_01075 [Sandaracinus sp.]|nr:hypothetical protein [Sandaracinus sp.]